MARKTIFILGSFVRPFVDVVLSIFFVFHSMSNCNSEVSQMKERSVLLVCEYGRLNDEIGGFRVFNQKNSSFMIQVERRLTQSKSVKMFVGKRVPISFVPE